MTMSDIRIRSGSIISLSDDKDDISRRSSQTSFFEDEEISKGHPPSKFYKIMYIFILFGLISTSAFLYVKLEIEKTQHLTDQSNLQQLLTGARSQIIKLENSEKSLILDIGDLKRSRAQRDNIIEEKQRILDGIERNRREVDEANFQKISHLKGEIRRLKREGIIEGGDVDATLPPSTNTQVILSPPQRISVSALISDAQTRANDIFISSFFSTVIDLPQVELSTSIDLSSTKLINEIIKKRDKSRSENKKVGENKENTRTVDKEGENIVNKDNREKSPEILTKENKGTVEKEGENKGTFDQNKASIVKSPEIQKLLDNYHLNREIRRGRFLKDSIHEQCSQNQQNLAYIIVNSNIVFLRSGWLRLASSPLTKPDSMISCVKSSQGHPDPRNPHIPRPLCDDSLFVIKCGHNADIFASRVSVKIEEFKRQIIDGDVNALSPNSLFLTAVNWAIYYMNSPVNFLNSLEFRTDETLSKIGVHAYDIRTTLYLYHPIHGEDDVDGEIFLNMIKSMVFKHEEGLTPLEISIRNNVRRAGRQVVSNGIQHCEYFTINYLKTRDFEDDVVNIPDICLHIFPKIPSYTNDVAIILDRWLENRYKLDPVSPLHPLKVPAAWNNIFQVNYPSVNPRPDQQVDALSSNAPRIPGVLLHPEDHPELLSDTLGQTEAGALPPVGFEKVFINPREFFNNQVIPDNRLAFDLLSAMDRDMGTDGDSSRSEGNFDWK